MGRQNFQYQRIFDEIKRFFEPVLSEYGFAIMKTSMPNETYGSVGYWFQKGDMQVHVGVNNYWDYPKPYLNVIFIHATSVPGQAAFPLWQLEKEIDRSTTYGVYEFEIEDEFDNAATLAVSDLLKYGVDILNGDVNFFRKYQRLHREHWANYYIEQASKNKNMQPQLESWIKFYKNKYSINTEE